MIDITREDRAEVYHGVGEDRGVEDLPGRLASIVQGQNLYADASISGNGGGWKEEPRRWPAARSKVRPFL
jgi:hypothetical protein